MISKNSKLKIENSPTEIKAVLLSVKGDVQGVSYRYWARQVSCQLGIVGWVKNEHDGSVTWFVQGSPGNVDIILAISRKGSPMSTVDDVAVEKVEADENIKGFTIK